MRKYFHLAAILAVLMATACEQPSTPTPDLNTKSVIPAPSADTLLENLLYELGTSMLETNTLKSANSNTINVLTLLVAGRTEAERSGYKISSDPVKVIPSVIKGITQGIMDSAAPLEEKVAFSGEVGKLYQTVALKPSLKIPVESATTWNQKDLTGKIAPAIIKPLVNHRAQLGGRSLRAVSTDGVNEVLAATLEGYASVLPQTDSTSTQDLAKSAIQSGLEALARSGNTDSELYATLLSSTTSGVNQSVGTLPENQGTVAVKAVESGGEMLQALVNDGLLTDATALNQIKTAITTGVTAVVANSDVSSAVTTALSDGIANPTTISDMVIKYPRLDIDTEDEFLVLKFSTISKVEKEEFWRGAVNTGTLVGEVLYAYDTAGNIISKTWKYGGVIWKVDNQFKFKGLQMIEDNNGSKLIYDDLGRIIDYNGYNKYTYNADGSLQRKYYGDTRQVGYADYAVTYKMGTTPVGAGYFWFGNHSTIKWLSWYDDDRYDIVSGIYTLTAKDKISTILHHYNNIDENGVVLTSGKEAIEFNDVGKVIQFKGGVKDDGTSGGVNYYDPFQRIKLFRNFDWTSGIKDRDTIYSYDNTGNVTAVIKHFDPQGAVIYQETFEPNTTAINEWWKDPRTTMKATRTAVLNNTNDPLIAYPAAYIIGDLSAAFTQLTLVDASTLTYTFTYANTMNAWEGGNGTLKFKLTQKADWTALQFGAGETALQLNQAPVIAGSNADGVQPGNFTVTGLVDGQSYTLTVTTNGKLVAVQIK